MAEPGAGATVLVLEDDPGIALLERKRLERAGYTVEVAATAEEARRRVEVGGIDILVLDYLLKGGSNGLDLHNALRAAGVGVPSVLVTGFGDEALLTRALRAGVRDFLPKTPDYLDYLVPTVARVIAQVRTERQLDDERAGRVREEAARAEAEAQRSALAESEARFRVLTQAIPQLVWSSGPGGDPDFFNGPWYEYTGQHPDADPGADWTDPVHPDDRPAMQAVWARAVADGQSFQTNVRIRRASDGTYRWHLARAWPQKDGVGRVVRWFGTCTDIDDQKRAEEALRDADRRKDEFLAMLAHELRNPLSAIHNAVAVVERAGDDESRRWAIGVIGRQAAIVTRLIDDLLDVSRVRAGKLRLNRQRIDAAEVVGHAAEALRPAFHAKRQALEVDTQGGPYPVDADPVRLQQVFVNLLNNAAKYTDEGGRVGISARREGGEVVVRVRDSGVGIAPEMLPRVFDLFTQVEGSLDRAGGGLGIGLTLVRTIVRMHGGSVSAASDGPGRGCEFTVRLPASVDGPTSGARESPPPASKRVLVVDDNADSARGLVRLLHASGHDARTADDGRSAVEAAREYRPDVVLLDIGLPDLDGYEVAARLRTEPGLEGVVLVALSGFGRDPSRREGFDHYLTKPVDVDALLRIVGAVPKPEKAE